MGYGTLGTPDVEITDMSDLVQTGSPTFGSDGKGGNAIIANGAGARGALVGGVNANQSATKTTFAFLHHHKPNSGGTYIYHALSSMESFFNVTGTMTAFIDTAGGAQAISAVGGGFDNSTTRLHVVRIDLELTSAFSIFLGVLGSAMTKYTSNTATVTNWNDDEDIYFGANKDGTFPAPNGSWSGQLRIWHGKYATDDDVAIINAEYDSGNFGASSGDGGYQVNSLSLLF